MDEDSDQEYEQIDVGKSGVRIGGNKLSSMKRPPIATPNQAADKAKPNQYTPMAEKEGVAVLPGVRMMQEKEGVAVLPGVRMMQEKEGVAVLPGVRMMQESARGQARAAKAAVPPPLPPPNTKSHSNSTAPTPVPVPPSKKPLVRSATVGDQPPQLPPKPTGPRTPSSIVSPVRRRKRVEDDFIIDNDEVTPEEFVAKYRDQFPLHVRVSKGFYGNSDRTSVSEGDTYNIHFIKNTQVICMEDGGRGEFKLALNSGIEFGLLFDPQNNRDAASKGYTYEKVSDILQAKSLPKVVRVGASWRGSSPESTIEMNQLLILQGWKRKIAGKLLKAYNPNTKKKKELPESCLGKFCTRPYDTRLFLTDIMEYVMHPLPSEAMLYMNCDMCEMTELPHSLTSTVIKLKALTTETTLIATAACIEEFEENHAVEIPLDLDIEFQVMRPKAVQDTEDLYQTTRKLLENITKMKTAQIATQGSESSYETQAALYSIIREGREFAGIDIVKPSAIYANSSSKSISSAAKPQSPAKTDSLIYDDCDESTNSLTALQNRIGLLEQGLLQVEQKLSSLGGGTDSGIKVSREITSARADMKRIESRSVKAGEDAAKAKADVTQFGTMAEQTKKMLDMMQSDMLSLKQVLEVPGASSKPGYMTLSHTVPLATADEESLRQTNKAFLATMDFMQVHSLLDCMGLMKHQDAFAEERVNGEILLECDDKILQEELKITSRLQRVRLLKVIEGRHSAEQILRGEDPYAYAKPR